MSHKQKIILVGGPDGTGKSTIVPLCTRRLQSFWRHLLHIDNEWAFSMYMRSLCSRESKIPLGSPDFARKFNLRGQLDFQFLARRIADQGFDVIMQGPFENLTSEVEGLPLYQKMKKIDFPEYDFRLVYLLMHPRPILNSDNIVGHPEMWPIEECIRVRLQARGKDKPVQQELDADKLVENYYSLRSQAVLRTYEMFPDEIHLVTFSPDDTPELVASELAGAIMHP